MTENDAKTRSGVSGSELDVLKTLWALGQTKVGAVRDHLNHEGRSWAYNTVQTLLNRLEAKGFVTSAKVGRAFVFEAAVTRSEFLGERLTDLADRVCEGSQTPLVLALVKNHRFSKKRDRAVSPYAGPARGRVIKPRPAKEDACCTGLLKTQS